MTQRQAIKLLESVGYVQTLGGKHPVKMVKPGHRPIVLPMCNRGVYSAGLTAAILRQAGLRGQGEDEDSE